MAELLNERIRNNASELRLHGVAESPDQLVERAEAADLGYREFLDLVLESEVGVLVSVATCSGPRVDLSTPTWKAAATPSG